MSRLSTISDTVDKSSGGATGFTPREAYASGIRGYQVSDYPLEITQKAAGNDKAFVRVVMNGFIYFLIP